MIQQVEEASIKDLIRFERVNEKGYCNNNSVSLTLGCKGCYALFSNGTDKGCVPESMRKMLK